MIPQPDDPEHRMRPFSTAYSPLKYQRLLRGWSQQDVVNELVSRCEAEGRASVGLTIDTLRGWENGYHKPSPLYRKHLCTLYDLTADKLGFIASQEVHP
jgi:transcriptional regulator with XRE-family HTH domain